MNNDNDDMNIFFIFLNTSFLSAEEDESNVQLYEKPVPENDFVNHCIQRRKYPVLLKVMRIRVVNFIFFIYTDGKDDPKLTSKNQYIYINVQP